VLALTILADGRFPAGGHAHSGGIEAAIVDGRVTGLDSLDQFVRGRLRTVGLAEAALAAATTVRTAAADDDERLHVELAELDAEAHARIASPMLRDASRRLGRQLVRVAATCWPSALFAVLLDVAPEGSHQPVALGVTAVAAGASAADAALLAVHHCVTGAATAAVRLLGLDPFAVAAMTAATDDVARGVVAAAVAAAAGPLADLPAASGPVLDIASLEHRARPIRMFAT
jgi:urease accessory protein